MAQQRKCVDHSPQGRQRVLLARGRAPGATSYLQNPLGQARFLGQLLEVLGVRVVVDGEVGFHGPELVVLEGGAHALGLLRGRVGRLVPVQVLGLVLVTACGGDRGQTKAQWKLLCRRE